MDWQAYNLWDYPQVIKRPMDLTTIKKNLEKGQYANPGEVAADIRLVWSNCMTYNSDGSEYWNLARKFDKLFDDKFKKVKGAQAFAKAKDPTREEKTQLAQNVYKISSEQLGRIVRILDENCERCIDKSSSDDMIEINVDLIDANTFRRVSDYVAECLSESASGEPAAKKAKH